jgi:hypothetical protein
VTNNSAYCRSFLGSVHLERLFPLRRKALSPCSVTKKASASTAASVKRIGMMGAVSAMMIVVSALRIAPVASAATVTFTITGTMASGTDLTGVFGFPANSDLTGQSFNLVFTFDDTKGLQEPIGSSPQCGSQIVTFATSNPGTAVLQIGSGTQTFGDLAGFAPSSENDRYTQKCQSKNNQIFLNIEDYPHPVGGENYIGGTLYPAIGAIPAADYSWEDSFSDSNLLPISQIAFTTWTTLGATRHAYGTLNATSIAIAGGPAGASTGLQFIPVTPCRVADTRNAAGPFGGPELAAGASREFNVPQSACSIPSSAVAYSLNVTAVPSGSLAYLTMWPSGQTQPTVSTLNSDGRVKANAAITPAGTNGGVSIFVTNPSHVILDINGYFVPAGTASALAFYPVTPCRVADTRNAPGPFGGPSLAAASSRDFPIQTSSCALPSDAKAYSLNVTAIPQGALGYLTMWPSGQNQPLVSTLNSPTGAATANAAIVPAGNKGDISVFVSNPSDVIVDVNGYFAAPSANGLSLYTTTPCRVIDTRNGSGAFNGKFAVDVESSSCAPSSTAQAYVLNATVVPTGPLGYLTLWPTGETQPTVSTLNASDGVVTSNMAVVPTVNGSIDAFSSSSTQLILDVSSYFAP